MRHATLSVFLLLAMLPVLADNHVPQPADGATSKVAFLEDYGRLAPKGLPRNRYLSFTASGAEGREVSQVHLLPITRFPPEASFPDIDEAVVAESLTFLDRQVRARFDGKVSIAAKEKPADVELAVVISGISIQEKGFKPTDLVPARIVVNRVKKRLLGDSLVAAVTVQLKLKDAKTGEILRESFRHFAGKGIGHSKDDDLEVTFEALEPALKDAAEFVADQAGPKL
ncbi:MAG: DUF3313 domain-containing protein [Gammaproteobacteria bacterium]|nr:DUF3313 domain-containing protein [Gammaproteobacteria bacterium]